MVRHTLPMSAPDPKPHLAKLSHHMDEMETLADDQFFAIAHGSPQALDNLLARLDRLKLTIELAAAA